MKDGRTAPMPTTLTELDAAVARYNREFRHPALPPVVMAGLYDLERDWPDVWPGADQAGVYVLLNATSMVLYVGKASCNRTLGQRLADHIEQGEPGKPVRFQDPLFADLSLRFVAIYAIPRDRSFEAPALEECHRAQGRAGRCRAHPRGIRGGPRPGYARRGTARAASGLARGRRDRLGDLEPAIGLNHR